MTKKLEKAFDVILFRRITKHYLSEAQHRGGVSASHTPTQGSFFGEPEIFSFSFIFSTL